MGFSEGDARRALADCSGVVGDAAERLIRLPWYAIRLPVAGASSSGGVGDGNAAPLEDEGEELAKGEGKGEDEDVDEEGRFTLLASSRRMPPGAEVVGRCSEWVDATRMQRSRGPRVHAML